MSIAETYRKIRKEVPEYVTIVLACKKRTAQEVAEVVDAGATDLGENYVQEGESIFDALKDKAHKVRWHMIGPLQKNKINKALRIFDMVQTVHSADQADALDKRAGNIGKRLSVLIEVNIGEESSKSGVPPEYNAVESLARHISALPHIRLKGLMTMGPFECSPEELRPYFRKTKEMYEHLRDLHLPDTEMKYLSMGMSDSYQMAIEEGSTMIRLGTIVFGQRPL